MESIYDVIGKITPPDENARLAAKRQWDGLAKPLGGLGLFEDMVAKLAALRGSADVRIPDRRLLVFCADNGVVSQGVTQCGSGVTAKVAAALAENRSSVSPLAACAACRVIPVDVGMLDFPGHPGVLNRRVRNGSGDISITPAMGRAECLAAMAAGAKLAMENAADGADLHAEKADGRAWPCGFASKSLYAAFPHLHFGGETPLARRFVKACEAWKASMT